MIQRTYGQCKAEFARICGESGMAVTDPRVLERTNLAQQELMNAGDFPNVVDRWHFRVNQTTGRLALPSIFDRLMQVTVDHVPTTIVSPYFEFVAFGPGINDDYGPRNNRRWNWVDVVTDHGDEPTQHPIPPTELYTGPWKIRCYATINEDVAGEPPEMNLQGLDEDGLIIRTLSDGTGIADDYTGENLAIDFAVPYTESVHNFSKITAVKKPETRSYVRITATNGSVEVDLSNYAYNETEPSYRIYYIPRLNDWRNENCNCPDRIILARCRKRFVPITEDNDPMIISNIPAMKAAIIAIWQREAGNIDAYAAQMAIAVDILKKEAMSYLGKARVPAVSFSRGFPMGTVPFVR